MKRSCLLAGLFLYFGAQAQEDSALGQVALMDAKQGVVKSEQVKGEIIDPLDLGMKWNITDLKLDGAIPLEISREWLAYRSPEKLSYISLMGNWQLSVPRIQMVIWGILGSVASPCEFDHVKAIVPKIKGISGFRSIAKNPNIVYGGCGSLLCKR